MIRIETVMGSCALALALVLGGCGGDSPSAGSVVGRVEDKQTGAPLSGVTVKLVDASFKIHTDVAEFGDSYTAMNEANQAAFVATQTTGADGTYEMKDVPNGTYTVVPSSPLALKFTPVGASSAEVTVDSNTVRGDFGADAPANDSLPFVFKVTFKNLQQGQTKVTVYRRMWGTFVPFFVSSAYETFVGAYYGSAVPAPPFDVTPDSPQIQGVFRKGFTAVAFTVDNAFYFELSNAAGSTLNTPLLSWPLASTPDLSEYTYDLFKRAFTPVAAPSSGQPSGG